MILKVGQTIAGKTTLQAYQACIHVVLFTFEMIKINYGLSIYHR